MEIGEKSEGRREWRWERGGRLRRGVETVK